MERLWGRTVKQGDCLLFTGSKDRHGYGKVCYKGKTLGAHRLAWSLAYGESPGKWKVCHSCDVRSCINPQHLWLGTDADNVHDAVNKGRHTGRPRKHPVGYAGSREYQREYRRIRLLK